MFFVNEKKIILATLVFFFVLFPLNQTFALIDVKDAIVRSNTDFIKTNTNRIAKLLAGEETEKGEEYFRLQAIEKQKEVKTLLRQVASSTVNWVNTGNNGNPLYITNAQRYLASTTDATINTFLTDEETLNGACETSKTPVKQALASQYQTFEEKITCTFTDTGKKDNFMNGNFIDGGGWDSWLEIVANPANNDIGAMVIANNELNRRIEANTKAAELEASWGNGVGPLKVCDPETADWDRGYDGCTVVTPGIFIAETLIDTLGSNNRVLEIAADYGQLQEITEKKTEVYEKVPVSVSSVGLGGKKINTNDVSAAFDEYMRNLNENQGSTPSETSPIDINTLPNSPTGTINTGRLPNTSTITNLPEINNNPYISSSDTRINFNLSITIDESTNNVIYIAKDTTIKLIDLQTAIEARYYNAQNNINNLLSMAENTFSSSTAINCTNNIKSEIIDQIQGLIPYDKTINGNLSWNKADVASSSAITLNNITALTIARMAVVSNPNSAQAKALVQNVINLDTMHSNTEVTNYSANGSSFNLIRNWVINKINAFGGLNICNINRSSFSAWEI